MDDRANHIVLSFHRIRCDYDNIFRHPNIMERQGNLNGFLSFGAGHRHDDQEIYVAIRPGLPSSIRSKENDPLRMESFHDSPDHFVDLFLNCRLTHSTSCTPCKRVAAASGSPALRDISG